MNTKNVIPDSQAETKNVIPDSQSVGSDAETVAIPYSPTDNI